MGALAQKLDLLEEEKSHSREKVQELERTVHTLEASNSALRSKLRKLERELEAKKNAESEHRHSRIEMERRFAQERNMWHAAEQRRIGEKIGKVEAKFKEEKSSLLRSAEDRLITQEAALQELQVKMQAEIERQQRE